MELTPEIVKNLPTDERIHANIFIAITMISLHGLKEHIKAGYTLEQLLQECDNFQDKYVKENEEANNLYKSILKYNPHKPCRSKDKK